MKIISGWKDYYDHVAHQYGGGDPKVVYHRDYVLPDVVSGGMSHESSKEVNGFHTPALPETMRLIHDGIPEIQAHEFRALIVMSRIFILERYGDISEISGQIWNVRKDWHVTSRTILDLPYGSRIALLRPDEKFTNSVSQYNRTRMQELLSKPENLRCKVEQGYKSEIIARRLCVSVGAPVFVIEGGRRAWILGRTPKLASLGVPAYIDATQLYQELAMFVGNVINPVEQPTSPMKDIEKVVSHGFDKKVSFRHRK